MEGEKESLDVTNVTTCGKRRHIWREGCETKNQRDERELTKGRSKAPKQHTETTFHKINGPWLLMALLKNKPAVLTVDTGALQCPLYFLI